MNTLTRCAPLSLAACLLMFASLTAGEPAAKKSAKPDAAKAAKAKEAKPEPKAKEQPAEKAPEKKEENGEEPKTHTVARGLIKVEVSAKGIFEGRKSAPIAVSLDEWKTLLIEDGAPHGKEVSKGDTLIRFKTKDIDESIEDQETSLELARFSLDQAEDRLAILEEMAPIDLDTMERADRHAAQDEKRYFEIDRPMSIRSAEYSLKSYQQMLDYEREELRQLEKMYEADELTEETEEIILQRQRNAVERAEFMLELAELRHEETLEIDMPRSDESIRDRTRRQHLATEEARAVIPLSLSRQRVEVEKMKVDLQRSETRLEKLLADREKLTVLAPIDGVVYYGKYVRGAWSGGTTLADNMRTGGKVNLDEVFMTVVQPRPLAVRVTVSEGDLRWFKPGLKGIVQPNAFPDLQLNGVVTRVDAVPLSGGSFGASVGVTTYDETLMPGMALTAKFIPYVKPRALTVPEKSVFTDDLNPLKKYVYLVVDGKTRKQSVEVGQKSGENLEILDGLSVGDKVLLEKPKDDN